MFSKFSCCRTIDEVESLGSKEEPPIDPQKKAESSDLPSKPESELSNSITAVEKTVIKSEDIVKTTVKKKLGPGLLGMVASAAIDADSKVSATIAQKLSTQIPITTKEMGLDLTFETVFREGPVVVFKATVNGAEPVKLVTSAKGKEAGEHFEKIVAALDVLGVEGGIKNIEGQMLPKIKQTLMEKLSSKIPEKMEEEGGLKVKCTSVEPGDQGDFFFGLIKELKMIKL